MDRNSEGLGAFWLSEYLRNVFLTKWVKVLLSMNKDEAEDDDDEGRDKDEFKDRLTDVRVAGKIGGHKSEVVAVYNSFR